jgi:hypothetical protein
MRARKSKEISSFRFLTYASRSISILAGCGFNEIGDRELVSPTYWADFEFKFTMSGHLALWPKGEKGALLPEFVYYVWKPDVVKAWPGLLKEHATPARERKERRRRDPSPTKHAGGRPRSFTSRQIGELQQEQSRYKKDHRGEPKKDVNQHLLNYAKNTWGIVTTARTLRNAIKKTAKSKN